ncbi:hypothetical protein [Streptomyces sp. WM6378]|uniref:hypothetical protein n=1 Tax=Streptomyces sp. WM6378 TaxID=1415557 RepID=UPI001F28021E|nr:hypothetical protein [Streptomyces sp. WM6378]
MTAAAKDQVRLLNDLGVRPGAAGTPAVDLGRGPGLQSLALAELGYSPVRTMWPRCCATRPGASPRAADWRSATAT